MNNTLKRSLFVIYLLIVNCLFFANSSAYAVPGMGAVVNDQGVTFRVWAGSAKSVSVAGTFNNWSKTANPLSSEGKGYWAADVSNAKPGDKYMFILKSAANDELSKNDPYARQLVWENNQRRSVIVNSSYSWAPFSMPNYNELIIYEMSVKTFGGYRGVVEKLDYLKDKLAVNAIEILPVHQTTTPGGGWGYNPSGMFAPHADYGSYEDFKYMVNEAHKRGIAVILDVVYNHIEGDVLWKYDGWTSGVATCNINDSHHWTGEHGGIYYYDWKNDYGRGWNWWHTDWGHNRPDYGREEVRNFIKDNAIYWLTEMNSDGLRFDSTSNIHHLLNGGGDYIQAGATLLKWINEEVQKAKPNAIVVAEDLEDNSSVTDTWLSFKSQWHASFVHKTRAEIKSSFPNMYTIKDMIRWIDNNTPYKLVKYVDSHDEAANGKSRLHQEIAGYSDHGPNDASYWSKKKNIIGHALAVFSPGIPMFLQGDECMTKGYFMDGSDMIYNFNREYADSTYTGIVKAFGDINRLKRNMYNNTRGFEGSSINIFHINDNDKVIAFHRWDRGDKGDDVIVIVNLGDKNFNSYNLGAPRSGKWLCRFNSDKNDYDNSFEGFGCQDTTANQGNKDNLNYNMNVAIGKFSVLVYSQ